jgi:hypothetical protein
MSSCSRRWGVATRMEKEKEKSTQVTVGTAAVTDHTHTHARNPQAHEPRVSGYR